MHKKETRKQYSNYNQVTLAAKPCSVGNKRDHTVY